MPAQSGVIPRWSSTASETFVQLAIELRYSPSCTLSPIDALDRLGREKRFLNETSVKKRPIATRPAEPRTPPPTPAAFIPRYSMPARVQR